MAIDVDRLTELLASGMSRRECADELGVGFEAVKSCIQRHGLRSRNKGHGRPAVPRAAQGPWCDERTASVRTEHAPRAASGSGPDLYSGGAGSSPARGSVQQHAARASDAGGPRESASVSGPACGPRLSQPGDVARDVQRLRDAWNPRKDPEPHEQRAPEGYHLRGCSTLKRPDGTVVLQWVKDAKDRDAQAIDAIRDALAMLPETWSNFHAPKPPPPDRDADLLAIYSIADAHIGMFSWAEETGNDYDVAIAERLHVGAIRNLVDRAPPAEQAIVANLGDMVHCDSNLARTARGGNPLDTDTRLHKVARVAVSVLHAAVDACLKKHKTVRVIVCGGNHDTNAASWLSVHLEAFYARDHRVTVDGAADQYHWHRFGKCMFGLTHGTGPKPEKLPPIMARERPADFGATQYRRWLTGHVHHQRVFEFPGCKVETFGTLAPSDAWAHGEGYMSERDMRVSIYHRELGERGQLVANVSELELAAS